MSFNRLFGLATIVVVGAGIVMAFVFLGTPAHQRLVTLDERRTRDLNTIASSINERYSTRPLPARLPEGLVVRDDVENPNYEYHRVDATHYQLCTVFATSGSVEGTDVYVLGGPSSARVWRHGAGRTCYQFDVTVSPPMPRPVSS